MCAQDFSDRDELRDIEISSEAFSRLQSEVADGALQKCRPLAFSVEFCKAERPSFSLKGFTAKYAERFRLWQQRLLRMLPGEDKYFSLLSVAACQPAHGGGKPVRHSPLRNEAKTRPRLGAFEIWLVWGEDSSDKVLVYSKLSTGRWPRMERMINDLHSVIPWLLATPASIHRALLDAHMDLKRRHSEQARELVRIERFESLYDAAASELEGKDERLAQCAREKKASDDLIEFLRREVEASAFDAEEAKRSAKAETARVRAEEQAKLADFKAEVEGKRQDESAKRKQALLRRTVARCEVEDSPHSLLGRHPPKPPPWVAPPSESVLGRVSVCGLCRSTSITGILSPTPRDSGKETRPAHSRARSIIPCAPPKVALM